jgi:hypothetical protein
MYETLKSTVRDTLRLDSIRHEGNTLPRSGAPSKVTPGLERRILRFIRRVPKAGYTDIQRECTTTLLKSTLYRLLKKHNITN